MVQLEVVLAAVLLSMVAFAAIMICLCVDAITIIKSRGSTLISYDSTSREQIRCVKKRLKRSQLTNKTSALTDRKELESNPVHVDEEQLSPVFDIASNHSTVCDPNLSSAEKSTIFFETNRLLSDVEERDSLDKEKTINSPLPVTVSVHSNAVNNVIALSTSSNHISNMKKAGVDEESDISAYSFCGSSTLTDNQKKCLNDQKNTSIKKTTRLDQTCACENYNQSVSNTEVLLGNTQQQQLVNRKLQISPEPRSTIDEKFRNASFSVVRCNRSSIVKTKSKQISQKPFSLCHTPVLPSSLHASGVKKISPYSSSTPSPSSLSSSSLSGSRNHHTILEDIKEDSFHTDDEDCK